MREKTLSRDDFAALLFNDDFFTVNTALGALAEQVTACRAAYRESAKKSSCGCGGDARLIFDCLDATLSRLEQLRTEDPAAMQTFVDYMRVKLNSPAVTTFVLYYRKTSETPLLKVTFPCASIRTTPDCYLAPSRAL